MFVRSHINSFTQQWQRDTLSSQSEVCLLLVMILTVKALHRDGSSYKVIFIKCLRRIERYGELHTCVLGVKWGPAVPRSGNWETDGGGLCARPLPPTLSTRGSLHSHTFTRGGSKGHHIEENQPYRIFL
ncbi:hypothetical protein mRhiFer1_009500 [Rhinolophus ferrumequinum]|uniref:Uncharacterized protein n=1 Tax=Rhinolophus ferrumequinum TaxID=59479 RepID=A0A7J7RAR9_RHIFE|nr:hypothetical protein mRhiFer1_009500 [Rhinolophus ferrumequinum]